MVRSTGRRRSTRRWPASHPRLAYREDMRAARERLAALPMREVRTSAGRVRFLDRGAGPAVLAVHGITEGAPGGLNLARAWVPDGFRVVVPSRFGYLGSDLPPGASPGLQADVFAELLDALGLDRVPVVAASAGATSALEFARRYPERTTALVLVSSNVPGPHHQHGPPRLALQAVFSSDPLLWAFRTYLPRAMTTLIGVPNDLELTERDRATLAATMDGVFPAAPRVQGVVFDAFASNPAVNTIPLEEIHVPVVAVHARDDAGPPYGGAVDLVRRLLQARLITIERGGHLMLGDHGWAIDEVHRFLRGHAATPSTAAPGSSREEVRS